MKLQFTVVSRLESINETGETGHSIVMVAGDKVLSAKLQIGTTDGAIAQNFAPGRVLEITMPTYQKPIPIAVMPNATQEPNHATPA